MTEIATPGQLRMSYLRWALVTVPAVVFATVWPALYICLGLSLAMVLHARGAKGRGMALLLFFVQLIANFAWSPLFFGAHEVTKAFYLIVFILLMTIATAFAFAPIRKAAAWLLVPYMIWLSFAAILNFQIDQRNPDAEALVPHAASTQI